MSKEVKVCVLPGCGEVIPANRTFEYRLGGHPGAYCASAHAREAQQLKERGRRFATKPGDPDHGARNGVPRVTAEDYGGAGVTRLFCDNVACGGPVTLSWRSRSGKEYCSKECMDTEEEEGNDMTEIDNETSPVTAGAPAPKKAAGKKAVKKSFAKAAVPAKKAAAPAKKAAAPKAAKAPSAGSARTPSDSVIVLKGKIDHDRKGKTADALNSLKNGVTVGKYREAVKAKNPKNGDWYAGWALAFAQENGFVALK